MKRFLLLTTAAAIIGGIFVITAGRSSAVPLPALEPVVALPASGSPPAAAVITAAAPTAQQYRVQAGDTLWAIGIRFLRSESAWSKIAAYNRIANPNLIYVGDLIRIPPASYTGSVSLPAPAPSYTPPVTHTQTTTRTYTPAPQRAVVSSGGNYASGSYQACVAMRESGNGSGSSNIYGFLQSTWSSLGLSGSPGGASRATQDAAFQRLYAMDGRAPWSPYDGC